MCKLYLFFTFWPLLFFGHLYSQTTYLPFGALEYDDYDRMEAIEGEINTNVHTAIKPYARSKVTPYFTEYIDYRQMQFNIITNKIDDYNNARAVSISGEWARPGEVYDGTALSKRPVLKYFYKTKPNLLHYSSENLFVAVNPVLYLQLGVSSTDNEMRYINVRGAEARLRLMHKVGAYFFVAETQEVLPKYFDDVATRWDAHPGSDYFSRSKRGILDGLQTRGYIDFPIYKDYITAQFGYDKHFIGEGIRSILLDKSGAPYTFLKLHSELGRFAYENIFMELMTDYYGPLDRILPRKYAAIHYLSMNVGRKAQIGLFESTVFSTPNKLKPDYLMPVILYRTAIQSFDAANHKSALGLNFKYYPIQRLKVYGQLFANSLDFKQLSDGGWKNQYATQLGLQYYNIAGLKNLDGQIEWNYVRPYTYSGSDSITNFSHYNQPLAHPLESGFNELILKLSYQPLYRLRIKGMLMWSTRGDTPSNDGYNVFENYSNKSKDLGYYVINSERKQNNSLMLLQADYELRTNLCLTAGISIFNNHSNIDSANNYSFLFGGIRWNIGKRLYDFW